MGWKQFVNAPLRRAIGYELSRPPGHPRRRMPPRGERFLVAPVFIFSAARSGSTLLRVILGSHSRLYAPPELPLVHLEVRAETQWIQTSMRELKLSGEHLEHMLWDRMLAAELARSGKPMIVLKTPSNVLVWRRIAACWPDARFIFLLRHPAASVASLRASWSPRWHPGESGSLAESIEKALRYMTEVEVARTALPGLTVRYEELTVDPEASARRMCDFLGVRFEPGMLDYGRFNYRFAPGLGDVSDAIRSGRIQRAAPPPDLGEFPRELREMCATWGYLTPETSIPAQTTPESAAAPAVLTLVEQPDG